MMKLFIFMKMSSYSFEEPLPSTSHRINDNKAQNVQKEGRKTEGKWEIGKKIGRQM